MSETIIAASAIAIPLIQYYEQCKLGVYKDSVGVATVGWGNTRYQDGRMVAVGDPALTQAAADALFSFYLQRIEAEVLAHATRAAPNELAAFTSLAYNIGMVAFTGSSALRLYLRADKAGAGEHIELWNEAGDEVLKGLQRRRRAEHLVFDGVPVAAAVQQAKDAFP
jgi:lysozyme